MIGQLASLSEDLPATSLWTGKRLELRVGKAVFIQILLGRKTLAANPTVKPLYGTVTRFQMSFEVIFRAVNFIATLMGAG